MTPFSNPFTCFTENDKVYWAGLDNFTSTVIFNKVSKSMSITLTRYVNIVLSVVTEG